MERLPAGLRRRLPKYCNEWFDKKTQKVQCYFRRDGVTRRLTGLIPHSPEFMAAYDEAMRACAGEGAIKIGADRTTKGSVNAALVAFYDSPTFKSQANEEQKTDRRHLEAWRKGCGTRQFRELKPEHVQKYINRFTKHHPQRNRMRSLGRFAEWALTEGLIKIDPTIGVKILPKPPSRGFLAWQQQDVDKFIARHPKGTMAYLAIMLLMYLGVRRGDVTKLGPQDIQKTRDNPRGILKQYLPQKGRKTGGREVTIALHDDLVDAIEVTATGIKTFLVTETGIAFKVKRFGEKMRDWCDEAGIEPRIDKASGKMKNLTAHGLRKFFIIRLAKLGFSSVEIRALTGHKHLKEIETYIEEMNLDELGAAVSTKANARLTTKSA